MFFIRQNATHKVVLGPAVAVGDGFTPVTTLALSTADEAEVILHDNGTIVSISGYTWAAIATADGYYHLTLQSGISGTVGHMTVVVNDDSLCLPLRADFTVLEEAVYDQMFAGSAPGAATVAALATAQTDLDTITGSDGVTLATTQGNYAPATAAALATHDGKLDTVDGIVDSILADTGTDGVVVAAASKTGYSLTATTGLGNQTANITGNLSGSVGSVTGAVGSVTGNVGGNVTGSVGSLATQAKADVNAEADTALSDFFTSAANLVDLVWDEVITGAFHNTNNSAAKFLREASEAVGVTGTAQAGGATSITLAATESATNDLYNFERVRIIEGTGAGQSRLITDYDGTTKVATVHRAWTTNPSTDSVYAISSADATVEAIGTNEVSATATVDFDDLASILLDTNELQTDWANGGRLDLLIDALATAAELAKVPKSDGTASWNATALAAIEAECEDALQLTVPDSVPADGIRPSVQQAVYMAVQLLSEFAISGTTYTVKKPDGSTTLFTLTLDDATSPTSATRAT